MHPTIAAAAQSLPFVILALGLLAALMGAGFGPSIQELRQKRAQLLESAQALIAKADAEKRDLTDDETGIVEKNTEEAKGLQAQVAAAERRQSAREAVGGAVVTLGAPAGRKLVDPEGTLALGASPAVAREAYLNDPMRGFRSLREFFLSVQAAGRGGKISANLKSLSARFGCQADGSPVRAAAGSDEQSGFSDPYGGFLVPKETKTGVLAIPSEGNRLGTYTRKVPMGSPKVAFNARVDKDHSTSVSGGLRAYRRSEAAAVNASRMSFEQVELNADPLMGVAFSTEELLADSPESIAAILEQGFQAEFDARIVREILTGSGAGEYLGVRRSGAAITVSKENAQTADTINWSNLIKMRARCWGYGNAIWVANPDTLPSIMGITQPGSTIPMFTQDAQGVERLFGRPIVFTEFAETLGDLGDILLLNLQEYLEGEYEPITGVSSMHVRFVEHEQAYKFTKRCAGAPWWRNALTPAKGTNTLSPIVLLEAR